MPASATGRSESDGSQSRSEATRPRLVFAACRAPYPLESGARIRTHHLLTGLAEAFETVFVTFEHHPDSPDGLCRKAELERLYPNVEVITVPGAGPHKRAGQAFSLLRRRSWSNGRYQSPAFTEAVRQAVVSRRPSIVHFDDLGAAQVGPLDGTFSVYTSPDVEQRILRLAARTGSVPRRLFNWVEAVKVRSEERRVWRSMDMSLAVSALDARAMSAGGARRVELCPNGAPSVERLPLQPLSAGQPLRLLFVGRGSYAPYERGLAWFVRKVLPHIEARTPVTLDVVGDSPTRPVEANGVRYVGRVPSIEPSYSTSHAVVVPVFEGSGTRLKILEAMAYGRPVISTRLGAEGLPVVAGQDFLQADEAKDFAAAVLDVAGWYVRPEGDELERLIANAREAVQPFLWPRIVEQLVELYRFELGGLEERLTEEPGLRIASTSSRGADTGPPDQLKGLLIINADDWGYDRHTTDAIHECFLAGAVTSVSAMVYMADSARAAALAASGGEPAGLHINLTEAFTDPACPERVRKRQQRIVSYFAGPSWRRWGFSPSLFTEIEGCIAEQLEAFYALYGHEPTHIDGHEHLQHSLTVMLARTIPGRMKMRPAFTFMPGEKSLPNRLTRMFVNRVMQARFRSPRYLFSIRDIHPALGGAGLEHKLDLVNYHTVEVMTHPGVSDERAVLLDDSWAELLRSRRVGAYVDFVAEP